MILNRIHSFRKKIFFYSAAIITANITLTALYSMLQPSDNASSSSVEQLSIISIFMVGFFAPFFEETLIRGLFQSFLQKKTKLPLIIIYMVVAACFSILHLETFFIPYFITSLFLSHSFYSSDNDLIVPLCCHINYNLFVLFLFFLQNSINF